MDIDIQYIDIDIQYIDIYIYIYIYNEGRIRSQSNIRDVQNPGLKTLNNSRIQT